MWCIPPEEDAAFVAQMEQVLDVYQRAYDQRYPVINMDEQHKQLIEETHQPLAASPGKAARVDYEYVRRGACVAWMFVEPLGGWRSVSVSAQRTAKDWARQVQQVVDHPRYARAKRITLVCDNLNTHNTSAFYETFPPEEALRLARKVELVHTPKHGSWLNMAECELSVLTRQCLGRRIASQAEVAGQADAWTAERNRQQTGVDWRFTTDKARLRLKYLYPKIKS